MSSPSPRHLAGKAESEQPFEGAVIGRDTRDRVEYPYGTPSELEGLPQVITRFLPDRALSSGIGCRADLVPAGEPRYWEPAETAARHSVTGDVVESYNKGRGYEVGENSSLWCKKRSWKLHRQRPGLHHTVCMLPRLRSAMRKPEKKAAAPLRCARSHILQPSRIPNPNRCHLLRRW